MIGRVVARYLLGWTVLMAGLVGLAWAGAGRGLGVADPATALAGVGVAAGVDLMTAGLIGCGLLVATAQFWTLWLVAVLAKLAIIAAAGAVVACATAVPVHEFLVATAASFVVFSHHEIFVLVRLNATTAPTGESDLPASGA